VLTEDDIVDAVCDYLEANGYSIQKRSATTERGDDIVAMKASSGITLYIEAKGETSNRRSSARFGKPFDSAQCRDHVANAFYSAASNFQGADVSKSRRAGIALPKIQRHQDCIAKIQAALDGLQIAIFWVSPDLSVRVASKWPV